MGPRKYIDFLVSYLVCHAPQVMCIIICYIASFLHRVNLYISFSYPLNPKNLHVVKRGRKKKKQQRRKKQKMPKNKVVTLQTMILRSNKWTNQNYLRELDFCADFFFKDYYPVAGSCTQRFMSLLHGKKLCRLLCHMTMPHMYVAWRDALASKTLDILLQYAQEAHHLDSDPYFLAGVACIKCRLCLESNCNEKAFRYCEEAESYLMILENGWQRAVILYTVILTSIRKSQLYKNNRREFLYECIDIFQNCIEGFVRDVESNFSCKYYHLAAYILVICIKIDLFVDSSKLSHWQNQTSGLFISKKADIKTMLRKANAMHQNLLEELRITLQNRSKFWPETLQNMKNTIEKCEQLMDTVPKTTMDSYKIRESARKYISVMIKTRKGATNDQDINSGTLFGGISKELPHLFVASESWIPAVLEHAPAASGSCSTSNWDHFTGTSTGFSLASGSEDIL